LKSIHSAPQVKLQNLIRDLRIGASMTQYELAAQLDKPQSYVAKIEGGERRVDVIEFVAICVALGVEPKKAFSRFVSLL
jgi:transcriptional regulator with XRE-family HTH domain